MRTNADLKNRLLFYQKKYFSDVEIKNPVLIRFGRKAFRQIGSIRKKNDGLSLITITSFFKDEKIPLYVIDETILHEFIHYTHGFTSARKQCYRYPHKHGIMREEFRKRHLLSLHLKAKKWLKTGWPLYLKREGLQKRRHRIRKHYKTKPWWFKLIFDS